MGVTVTQPSVIKVQVGGKPTTVQSINYGSKRLKELTDVSLTGAQNGDVLVYQAANGNFTVTSAPVPTGLDAGFF